MLKSTIILPIFAAILAAISGAALALIVLQLSPDTTGGISEFYGSVFVLAWSLTFLIGYGIRRIFGVPEFALRQIRTSARQSLWFAILIFVFLALLSWNLFNILNISLLVLALIFLEAYFLFK
ncbi:MAG TPA: hypothetical protein VFX17_01610 [Patescibacteria group bacterium]|nr:hypothetical protein [Patescibacteria group bacterium]